MPSFASSPFMVIWAEVLAATFWPFSALKSAKPGRAQHPRCRRIIDIGKEVEALVAACHLDDGSDAAEITERHRSRGQCRDAIARSGNVLELGIDPLFLEVALVDRAP